MNAIKNANEAEQNRYKTAGDKDKILQAVTDDGAKVVEDFTASNRKMLDNINLAKGFMSSFDALKNTEPSAAGFAGLVKSVNKLIEPMAAVMSDDMSTMAQYGGGANKTIVEDMLLMMQQIVSSGSKAAAAIVSAIPGIRVSTTPITIMGQSIPMPQIEVVPGKSIDPKSLTTDMKNAAKGDTDATYINQWNNIVKVGEIFSGILRDTIKVVKDGATQILNNAPNYAQFRNSNSLALSTGKTVQELISEDPGKGAWDAALSKGMDAFAMAGVTQSTPYIPKVPASTTEAPASTTEVPTAEVPVNPATGGSSNLPPKKRASDVNAQGIVTLQQNFPVKKSSNLTAAQIKAKKAADDKAKADAEIVRKAKEVAAKAKKVSTNNDPLGIR
jgi:hypothetical protein